MNKMNAVKQLYENASELKGHTDIDLLDPVVQHLALSLAEQVSAPLLSRIAELEAALAECHDALQAEESQHACGDKEKLSAWIQTCIKTMPVVTSDDGVEAVKSIPGLLLHVKALIDSID